MRKVCRGVINEKRGKITASSNHRHDQSKSWQVSRSNVGTTFEYSL